MADVVPGTVPGAGDAMLNIHAVVLRKLGICCVGRGQIVKADIEEGLLAAQRGAPAKSRKRRGWWRMLFRREEGWGLCGTAWTLRSCIDCERLRDSEGL